MHRRTAVPAVLLAAGLALAGCGMPSEAEVESPQPDPTQPAGVVRTPEPVQSAPLTVPLPGSTNSPNVSGDLTPTPSR